MEMINISTSKLIKRIRKENEKAMKSMICLYFMFSLILLRFRMTSASQLIQVPVGGDEDGGGNYKCIQKEKEALLHFKSHIQEDWDNCLSTWTREEEDDCCQWKGITCDNQTRHVTELNLSCYFRGEISPSLLNLTSLHHLDLSGSSFNGTIPGFIGTMTQLTYLDLSGNSFNGTILGFIGSVTQLRYLDLSSNSFSGIIPGFIRSMTQLTYLDLSGNSFNGTIPSSVGSLIALRYLDLSYNFLNGTIPPELGNLTNLKYLYLSKLVGCKVENLDWMSHLYQLEILDMSGTSLAKANHWVNVVSSLPKLSFLLLSECELSHVMHPYSSSLNTSSSSSIVYLSLGNNNLNSSMSLWLFPLSSNKLEHLSLSDNMLDGIPKYLGDLCNLTSLDLDNNMLTVKFLDLLNNLYGCTSLRLQSLYASYNQLTGSLCDVIQMFSSLEELYLRDNKLNGTISEKVWELPKLRLLDVSSNSLRGAISDNIGKSRLIDINLSGNSIEGVPSKAHISNLSYVQSIDLSSCKQLGPHFPNWIQALKNLTKLDITNTRISDMVPVEFWNMWPTQLTYLNLSSNNLSGKIPDLESNFNPRFSSIDLSSNNFYGPIRNVTSRVVFLDLSKNRFSGGISFLCQIYGGLLSFLDLSNNSLTGPIPHCLWHFKELRVLNLGENNLFGRIPASVKYLINLEALFLNNNNFSGGLPLSLKNCSNLEILNLGDNKFSDYVPFWIGEKLSGLYALSLTSNNFFGTIPSQLCKLVNIQILDLSMNDLNGTIPSCLNNLSAMVQNNFLPYQNVRSFLRGFGNGVSLGDMYVDHAMIKWQGVVREFSNTLGLVRSIDLSSNSLTGQIPNELTNLYHLLSLNLSNNHLSGEIPKKIGEMKNLLALDLSRNQLSGGMPPSMSNMTLLNYLDVSYNNLSGRIPSSTQLQSFEPSSYNGNAGLCGSPLPNHCLGNKEIQGPHVIGESEDDGEGIVELNRWFYIGGATGFPIGFSIVFSTVLFNRRARHAFLVRFSGSLENRVYLKVVVFVAKLQRVAHA